MFIIFWSMMLLNKISSSLLSLTSDFTNHFLFNLQFRIQNYTYFWSSFHPLYKCHPILLLLGSVTLKDLILLFLVIYAYLIQPVDPLTSTSESFSFLWLNAFWEFFLSAFDVVESVLANWEDVLPSLTYWFPSS